MEIRAFVAVRIGISTGANFPRGNCAACIRPDAASEWQRRLLFYPVHNKSEQGATTWGVVSLKIQLGQIIQHEFVPLTELEDRYG